MARETQSEKLVRIANVYYKKNGIARIVKNDPEARLTGNGLLFSASRGLDFSGSLKDGKHIEFEVKETEKIGLPMSSIRMSQLDQMEDLVRFNSETFLLVLFKSIDEWYLLEYKHLEYIASNSYSNIPITYFRSFGFRIPLSNGFPDYLNPESHPDSNALISTFPKWMPAVKHRKIKRMEAIDHLDIDARRNRIKKAIETGIKKAGMKYKKTQIFKQQAIMRKKYGES